MQRSGGRERHKAVMGGETDAEWIARGGHLLAKGSREQQMNEPTDLPNLNDSTEAWSPEHGFWHEFFDLAINDALSRSPGSNKVCQDCHVESGDGCCDAHGNFRGRTKHCTFAKTIQQCGLEWFSTRQAEETCTMLGIELTWVTKWLEGKLNEKTTHVLPAAPSLQRDEVPKEELCWQKSEM